MRLASASVIRPPTGRPAVERRAIAEKRSRTAPRAGPRPPAPETSAAARCRAHAHDKAERGEHHAQEKERNGEGRYGESMFEQTRAVGWFSADEVPEALRSRADVWAKQKQRGQER